MASTPETHITTPILAPETSGDGESSIFHHDGIARLQYYMDFIEVGYVRPVTCLLHDGFATNPVTTVFLVTFGISSIIPVVVFMSTSIFTVVLALLAIVSTGVISVVAIQSTLFIALSISILLSAVLSATTAAIYYATSWFATAAKVPFEYTREISIGAGAEGVAAAQSLAATVTERVPDWRDAVIDQTSVLRERVAKVPFAEWCSQLLRLWFAIPWGHIYSLMLTSVNTMATVIHAGFSIAQLITFVVGFCFKVVHAMIFCGRLIVAGFQRGFVVMQTPSIQVDTVRESVRGGEEVGVSTGVSPAVRLTQTTMRNKGKEALDGTSQVGVSELTPKAESYVIVDPNP